MSLNGVNDINCDLAVHCQFLVKRVHNQGIHDKRVHKVPNPLRKRLTFKVKGTNYAHQLW